MNVQRWPLCFDVAAKQFCWRFALKNLDSVDEQALDLQYNNG